MPDYIPDPKNPGQHISTIELLRRDPLTPPPVYVEELLRRDQWTRQEALLILAGLSPRNVVHGGYPIGTIGAGIVYLDGLTSAQLDAQGLEHPRAQNWLPEFDRLKGYAAGQDMGERKKPDEWLAWAKSKGFTPYWSRSVMQDGAQRAGTQQQPESQWDDLAEVRLPGGMRLISKRRAVDALLDAVHPLPAATMDGPVRKSYLAQFMPEASAPPPDELAPDDEARLEEIWRRAGLPWPDHPTEAEWKGRYLQALQDAPDRPDWLPVSTWGANCRIAEQSREAIRRAYLADVFQGLPAYASTGMQAPPEFADFWNTKDVAAAVERMNRPYRVAVEPAMQRDREALRRYALWDAAKAIGDATAAPFEPVLEALIEAANRGELTIYQAGVKFPHKPEGPLGALAGHEAYWADLNTWLRAHKVQGDFAFPAPQEAPAEQPATVTGHGTPAEQWEDAKRDMKRKHELANAMVKACQDNKAEAARRLGTRTAQLYRALQWEPQQSKDAMVAFPIDQLTGGPHRT